MINRSIAEHTLPRTNRPRRSWRLRAVRAWCVLAAALLVGPTVAAPAGEPGSLSISEKSFRCMTEKAHIGHFYVDHLVGNLHGTVRVPQSSTCGVFPLGPVPSRPPPSDR